MAHFHSNVHVPGYLPESDDVPTFDTAADGWEYLYDEIGRAWDGEYDASESDEERASIDERYGPARLQAQTCKDQLFAEAGGVHIDGPSDTHLGWIYEVTACNETECDVYMNGHDQECGCSNPHCAV